MVVNSFSATHPPVFAQLLGKPFINFPNGKRVNFQGQTSLFLLAYLCANSETVFNRGDLTTLFFPDLLAQRAEQNMRQAIHRLVGLFKTAEQPNPPLAVEVNTIRFDPAGSLATDINRVDLILRNASDVLLSNPHRRPEFCLPYIATLEPLLELEPGKFLEDIQTQMDNQLDTWVASTRSRYSEKIIKACDLLARHYYAKRQFDLCFRAIEQINSHDPYFEPALRLKMKALAATGKKDQALLQFHDHQRALRANFRLPPEQETLELAQRIRANKLRAPSTPIHIGDPAQVNNPSKMDGSCSENIDNFICNIGKTLDLSEERALVIRAKDNAEGTKILKETRAFEEGKWPDGIHTIELEKRSGHKKSVCQALLKAIGENLTPQTDVQERLSQLLRGREALFMIEDMPNDKELAREICWLGFSYPRIKFVITTRHEGVFLNAKVITAQHN